ncbi:hypothetical protein F4553_001975 [Allocatelliglobosispora scoriae]|uniref:Uncharacterized protein n=1 Tax=Allocatelliglobosispora scoriae TaxID=643052 RepID=A0A841BMU5_9ACTN|nr:hypothetical protein [Allocatelliglobosispora scoriae]MBB5868596.1 hypothetical protein [Allocatelliglobosispora scoriae]
MASAQEDVQVGNETVSLDRLILAVEGRVFLDVLVPGYIDRDQGPAVSSSRCLTTRTFGMTAAWCGWMRIVTSPRSG